MDLFTHLEHLGCPDPYNFFFIQEFMSLFIKEKQLINNENIEPLSIVLFIYVDCTPKNITCLSPASYQKPGNTRKSSLLHTYSQAFKF